MLLFAQLWIGRAFDPALALAEARTAAQSISVEDTFVRGLLSGAATRAAKEVLLHPIDTVKTRLQMPGARLGSEGLLAKLYSGVVPAVLGGVRRLVGSPRSP